MADHMPEQDALDCCGHARAKHGSAGCEHPFTGPHVLRVCGCGEQVIRPRLLDAFNCAGGASWGYHLAGWEVEGIEIDPRPDYPFKQHVGDAVAFIREHGNEYDAVVGSPPCQALTTLTQGNRARGWTDTHVDLIEATREAMIATGKPYIIENVMGARPQLRDPVMLCGLSFGLRVFRHRLFESNVDLTVPDHTSHKGHRVAGWRHGVKYEGDMFAVYGDGGGKGTTAEWQSAMGIDWTEDRVCLAEAIPPAYTQHLGRQLMASLLIGAHHNPPASGVSDA